MLKREDREWPRYLPAIQFAYNTKVNAITKVTPFFAFTGREACLPLDLLVALPKAEQSTVSESVRDTLERIRKIYAYVRSNGEAVIKRNANLYTGRKNEYTAGQLVYYYVSRRIAGKPEKWLARWVGPFKVVAAVSEVLLKIKACSGLDKILTVHISRVRPYAGPLTETAGVGPAVAKTLGHEAEEVEAVPSGSAPPPPDLSIPVRYVHEAPRMEDLAEKKKAEADLFQKPAEEENHWSEEDTAAEKLDSPPKVPSPVVDDEMESDSEAEAPDEETEMEAEEAPDASAELDDTQPLPPQMTTKDQRRGQIQTRAEATSAAEDTAEEQSRPTGSVPSSQRSSSDRLSQTKRRRKRVKVKELLRSTPSSSEAERMATMTVQIRTRRRTPLPSKRTAAGLDLFVDRTTRLAAGKISIVPTGVGIKLPPRTIGRIDQRSGLA